MENEEVEESQLDTTEWVEISKSELLRILQTVRSECVFMRGIQEVYINGCSQGIRTSILLKVS